MKMCQTHWNKLRQAIKARGLFDLVAPSGEEVVQRMKNELKTGKSSLQNYDPLMGAHNMIVGNAMQHISSVGANPMILFQDDLEHPELSCPICCLNYLSAEHDRTCTEPNCKKPRGLTFEDWIDKAADGAAEFVKTIKPT